MTTTKRGRSLVRKKSEIRHSGGYSLRRLYSSPSMSCNLFGNGKVKPRLLTTTTTTTTSKVLIKDPSTSQLKVENNEDAWGYLVREGGETYTLDRELDKRLDNQAAGYIIGKKEDCDIRLYLKGASDVHAIIYCCHPKISAISNKLFYDRRLLNGVTPQDREPLLEGLPTVLFVDIGGTEQKSARTNSFWNDTEVSVTAKILQSMIELNVLPSEIGVVSLYKEQADKLSDHLAVHNAGNSTYKNIQISTVDAFQGGEKEIIILSTVRTTESAFMQNEPRINVALTRAKRHLIILGDRHMLLMNDLWSKIIWDCEGKRN
ncbi:hypothetical protein RMATCC62417_15195 [Rhizopus microsporus]|nr:hypothetical protein RMATCC62417_15195 [Rhizopus microsporus]